MQLGAASAKSSYQHEKVSAGYIENQPQARDIIPTLVTFIRYGRIFSPIGMLLFFFFFLDLMSFAVAATEALFTVDFQYFSFGFRVRSRNQQQLFSQFG